MRRIIVFLVSILLLFSLTIDVFAESGTKYEAEQASADLSIDAKSAILIEAKTGTVLYEKDADTELPPASVTKTMTLLLVMEAVENGKITLDESVRISAYAASMGGSQVFLEEGESFTVEELIKCAVIASANDASVALAEHSYGSEEAFVNAMNRRARELGLKSCSFENVTGLDDTTSYHYMSARDIAVISRELISNELILKYSSLWQDSIRNGEFTLTNTNRLVRYYDGCNGLKTGSTDKAGFCISATAKRNEMQLIAVIMGSETRDKRNAEARALLDFGFANFALFEKEEGIVEYTTILGAKNNTLALYQKPFSALISKDKQKNIEIKYEIPEVLSAPLEENSIVGKIKYYCAGELIGESDIYVKDKVEKLGLFDIFSIILKKIF